MSARILQGGWLEVLRTLPDESVHCVVTSPPYWGLRDYGIDGQLGLERTPEEYVAKMVAGFREVRRVLRSDGTCWVNLGDSYAAQRGGTAMPAETLAGGVSGRGDTDAKRGRESAYCNHRNAAAFGLKHKDLAGIPWRVAFALQADGWWLRQDIIWAKPNPMPESVTDRCTKSHEYIFLLTKSERYFYDADAIKEDAVSAGESRGGGKKYSAESADVVLGGSHNLDKYGMTPATRNKRSVWNIATKPYSEAHFATFPPEIPETCIKAGTSERGCCAGCGSPWERVTETERRFESGSGKAGNLPTGKLSGGTQVREGNDIRMGPTVSTVTTGWQPTCTCNAGEPVPCTVMDIFNGAGTTGLVATRLGRNYIGIDLNTKYNRMATDRIIGDAPLFNEVTK